MNESEKIFCLFLQKQGFEVCEFSKDEKRILGKKTPDFKVFLDKVLQFYCEVKEINEDERDYGNGTLKDNTYNIVSDCIYESYAQFKSVNENYSVPNILAIYSDRFGIDISDYKLTCEGGVYFNDNKFHPILKNVSEGKIKEKKEFIDLCIWYDKKKKDFSFICNANSKYKELLYNYFNSPK